MLPIFKLIFAKEKAVYEKNFLLQFRLMRTKN